MDGLSNHTYKVFSNPNTFDSIRSLASKEKRGKCPLLSLVYCSGLGFQVSANTPPMIASIPPGAVTTPKSESMPKMSITTPQLCVELGLLFIITAPIMMMIPNMRKAQTRKEERDQCIPTAAQISPPNSTSMPPIKDSMKAVVGFSLMFPN